LWMQKYDFFPIWQEKIFKKWDFFIFLNVFC